MCKFMDLNEFILVIFVIAHLFYTNKQLKAIRNHSQLDQFLCKCDSSITETKRFNYIILNKFTSYVRKDLRDGFQIKSFIMVAVVRQRFVNDVKWNEKQTNEKLKIFLRLAQIMYLSSNLQHNLVSNRYSGSTLT